MFEGFGVGQGLGFGVGCVIGGDVVEFFEVDLDCVVVVNGDVFVVVGLV